MVASRAPSTPLGALRLCVLRAASRLPYAGEGLTGPLADAARVASGRRARPDKIPPRLQAGLKPGGFVVGFYITILQELDANWSQSWINRSKGVFIAQSLRATYSADNTFSLISVAILLQTASGDGADAISWSRCKV